MTESAPTWDTPSCARCGERCIQCWFQVRGGPVCFDCATDDEMLASLSQYLDRLT